MAADGTDYRQRVVVLVRMTTTDVHIGISACPACDVTAASTLHAKVAGQRSDREIALSLPTIHRAACISTVERGLLAVSSVSSVRVNLTRKRAIIHAAQDVTDDILTNGVGTLNYDAQPLDQAVLSADQSDRAAQDVLMRFCVAGFAMMNVMLLAVAAWSGASDAARDLFHWISVAIALPTIIFTTRPFHVNA